MNTTTYLIILLVILILGTVYWLFFRRNRFNAHKYVRLVTYNKDKSVKVQYFKREKFNLNQEILVDSERVFNFKGYTTLVTTSESKENINPLDFETKYNAKDYESAINSKLIKDTFATLKVEKFDKVMFLLGLSVIQLLAIIYLIYNMVGGGVS